MKLIILLLFFATIILKTPVPLPKCDIDTAKIAVPPRIFEEVTIDGIGKNIYFTRFLHNKPGIFMSEFARCYFNVFDLSYLLDTLGIFGFVAFIYFAYRALLSRRIFLILLLMVLPVIPFFQMSFILFAFLFKILALIGAVVLVYLR